MIFCGTAVYIKPPPTVMVLGRHVLDSLHGCMKAIELRGAPRGGDHVAKKHHIGAALFNFIEHAIVIECKRAAVKHLHLGGILFSDEGRKLRVQ